MTSPLIGHLLQHRKCNRQIFLDVWRHWQWAWRKKKDGEWSWVCCIDFSILMSWCATPGYKTTNYCPIRALFNWVSKVISRLLWFCFTSLCNWPAKHVSPSQPISSKTKTNHALLARVFPRLASVTYIFFDFWLVHCAFCVCCDWPKYLLWFWLYDTQMKTVLIKNYFVS